MLIKKAIIRGIIPLIIMTTLSIIMKYQGIDVFQVKGTFLVGIIATSIAAASVIYEIEKWSLLKQSIVHFIIMFLTVFPCLLISGWYELNSALDYLKVFGMFLLVGIVLWSVAYFIFGKILDK
ncbi:MULTISPECIES: DUF3021 family protein [Terrabacteria group]|uniref:DUF3021 family protein n=1 Tax=Bacillati TaxID=1783272 RepID=UPI001C6E632F|nr:MULTISPECIES: DUF3021 family protein [Terrabacteria group]MBW9213029.1 DUF3021 domain-containing protein [Trueperella sp. zg.1013]